MRIVYSYFEYFLVYCEQQYYKTTQSIQAKVNVSYVKSEIKNLIGVLINPIADPNICCATRAGACARVSVNSILARRRSTITLRSQIQFLV